MAGNIKTIVQEVWLGSEWSQRIDKNKSVRDTADSCNRNLLHSLDYKFCQSSLNIKHQLHYRVLESPLGHYI